jgi:hypothetical protein
MLVFTPLTKTIKLLSFDDNDFKIAHPSDFFLSDDNDKFLTNRRVYTSYRIVIVLSPDSKSSHIVVREFCTGV